MICLLIIALVLLIILCYLLFAPFYLEVDSSIGLCCIRFHKVASAGVYLTGSSLFIHLKILWWYKEIDLLAPKEIQKKVGKKSIDQVKRKKRKMSAEKVLAVIKSFRVNKFLLSIDTGDMQLNGILYPLFLWLNRRTGKAIAINFRNKNEMIVEIENNFFRMLRVYIIS